MTAVDFTTSGTWQSGAGVTAAIVECWAGGGKGSKVLENSETSGPIGGGGGAYAMTLVSLVPGRTYNAVVGSGSDSTSSAAGDSYFGSSDGTSCFAKGAGAFSLGGNENDCTGDVKDSGGNGNVGYYYNGGTYVLVNGGGGGACGGSSGGEGPVCIRFVDKEGGAGGVSDRTGGNGGPGGWYTTTAALAYGADGTFQGGGGGGSGGYLESDNIYLLGGGDGANGLVRINYTPGSNISVCLTT